MAARSGRCLASPAIDRAIAWLNARGFPTAEVLGLLASQSAIEAADPANADAPTRRSFGLITGFLADLVDAPTAKPALTRIGEAHGRLIYWEDARQDQAQDRRAGHFNALTAVGPALAAERTAAAWHDFLGGLRDFPALRHAPLLAEIGERTAAAHRQTREEKRAERRERRRVQRERDGPCSWCHSCDDCCNCCSAPCPTGRGVSHACDACFDCGPGDTGCCDCADCCHCHCGH